MADNKNGKHSQFVQTAEVSCSIERNIRRNRLDLGLRANRWFT